MYISDILRRSGRNLRQAKARTILTAMAIGVGAFALTLTLAASNGARDFVNGIIEDNFDPSELIVARDDSIFNGADTSTPQEYDETFGGSLSDAGAPIQIKRLDQQDIQTISEIEGVESVRLDIVINLQYIVGPNNKRYVATVQTENPFQQIELVAGDRPKPLANKQLLVPEAFLDALGFQSPAEAVGKPITLAVRKTFDPAQALQQIQQGASLESLAATADQTSTETSEFTIAGVMKKQTIVQPGTELYLYGGEQDLKVLQEVTTRGTADYQKYLTANARVENGEDETQLRAVQDRIEDAGYASFSAADTQAFLNQAISVLQGIVVAFSLIAVFASIFGVINTMYISVLQRTREIGLMKALGMRKRDVSRLFRFEAAWIGFLGGTIGAGLAVLLGLVLNPWITKQLDLGTIELLQFDFVQIAILIVALMLVAVFAGLFPARKAAKLDPIEALRTE